MNSYGLRFILLCLLLTQAGCDITLKKKYSEKGNTTIENTKMGHKVIIKKKAPGMIQKEYEQREVLKAFTRKDKAIITAYYKNNEATAILHYANKHSPLDKKQEKELLISKSIPQNIQLIPLPLDLDKHLTEIPASVLRVQVSNNIILMDVRTRNIIDIIKL